MLLIETENEQKEEMKRMQLPTQQLYSAGQLSVFGLFVSQER